jgi:rhodanese-related sulfurtransferase
MFATACSNAQQKELSPDDFEKAITANGVQLLDVRTADEYKQDHMQHALQADWLNTDEFQKRIQYLDKTKPVYVYCASGVRSGKAAQWMRDNGFVSVTNLKGGMAQWKMADKPVEGTLTNQMQVDVFNDVIKNTQVVLVDVGAEWCPPCKTMQPVLDKLKTTDNNFKLLKVDGGIDVDVMKSINAQSLPTFIVYKNGKETWRKEGVVAYDELEAQLK